MALVQRTVHLARRSREGLRYVGETVSGPSLWTLVAGLFVAGAFISPQLFSVGLIVGSVYALGAIGLTLIYGVLRFANFAHGDLMMLGAYLAFLALTGRVMGQRQDIALPLALEDLPGATRRLGDLTFGYGLLLAAAVAAVLLVLVCVGLDRAIYRPLRQRGAGVVILAICSLGVAIAVRSVMLLLWGPDPRLYVPGIFPARTYPFDVRLKTNQVFTLAVAIALAGLVYLLLYRTKLGKAMRAMADNPDLARVSGIDVEQVVVWTWAVGGALMAVAGVLLALQAQLSPDLGFVILLPLFAAAILGGIGHPVGALLGALVVGVAQEVSVELFRPDYKPGVAFVILVLILLLRPRGLMGAKT